MLVGLAGIAAPFAAPAAAQSGPAVGFGDAQTTVAQGDVATIDLQLRNTDQATLRIRSADQKYQATLRVRDGDNDGMIRVRANTFRGIDRSDAGQFTAQSDADEVRLIAESKVTEASVLDTGRYNLIVSTAETSVAGVLTISEPVVTGSDVRAVAPNTPLAAAANGSSNESNRDEDITAARGDHVRTRFAVGGLGGILEAPTPAANLVYPDDSAPGVLTTHTVQTSPNKSISARSLTIDYGVDDGTPPKDVYHFSQSDIESIGIDETGDGYIDRSIGVAVQNIQTGTDGRITLSFDRPVTIPENHTFRLAYAMENPEAIGSQPVAVRIHGRQATHRDRGTVLYGPAGQGTLGYGVDLQLTAAGGDTPTGSLSGVETTYDADAGGLVATIDTSTFETGEYQVTLDISETAPDSVPRVSLHESFTVVEPDVTFTSNSASDDTRLSVTADTNLAPGSSVIVRVSADQPTGGISQVLNCVGTVEPDGSVDCEFDLSKSTSDFDIDVSMQRDGVIIAGPTDPN
ncbi:hypothetical protein DJ69_00665 [Halorubrum persicum]|uniref:DUF7827 domain-containing protein n=1 Tax=Halorubrum persicum TaxID=1383844 RepID=A0A2G1WNS8_9EURY|nr:hypothetical protein DJ69_00665 [Halorubrum persicum]